MRKSVRMAAVGLLALGLSAPATAAFAKDGDVIKRGSCTGASDWKLKGSPEDGLIEVEFEVDSNVNGQTWNVKLFKNGNRIFNGDRVTQPPSGSFEVERRTSNPAGTDRLRGRAVNASTGEVCQGQLQFPN